MDNQPPSFDETKGIIEVKDIISKWSKVYIHQIFFLESVGNCWQYEVEFSKPMEKKPIPHGTVKIFFSIYEQAEADAQNLLFEFNFENESLIHKYDNNTMRTNMFESWINNVLEKKFKI